jgi:phage FluMu protein Com
MSGVSCTRCGERFYWTEHYGEKICPRCKAVEFYAAAVSSEYTAPECPFDFSAAARDRIIEDVTLHGATHRCSLDLSTAFAGWNHEQIDQWCSENGLVIIARPDGRIVIYRVESPVAQVRVWINEMGVEVDGQSLIRAEVEAMDWPQLFEDSTLAKVIQE